MKQEEPIFKSRGLKSDDQANLVVFIKKSLRAQLSDEMLRLNLKKKLEELIQIELKQLNAQLITE